MTTKRTLNLLIADAQERMRTSDDENYIRQQKRKISKWLEMAQGVNTENSLSGGSDGGGCVGLGDSVPGVILDFRGWE